jgi:tripartite-type tricarboxylate transporter receptor subunit TctC
MRFAALGALAAILGVAQPASAAEYPSEPVRLIVPYAPGGVLDTTARLVGQELQRKLGQSFIIENRPGGNAAIGTAAAAKAKPDGYTLLIGTSAEIAVAPALRQDLPYDMDKDFVPITLVNDTPIVVIASQTSGLKTMADVLAAAKKRSVSFGTPGAGSSHHLLGESIAFAGGVTLNHIPYPGAAPAATAVAGGHVDLGIASISAAMPHIQSGKAVAVAVATPQRVNVLSTVPTLKESGLDLTSSVWIGLFAPAGTPDAVVQKMNAVLKDILHSPLVVERFAASGAVPLWSSPAELTERRRAETATSRTIVQRAGIKPE